MVFPDTTDSLRQGDIIMLTLPRGINARLIFSVNADYEQGVCIYGPTGYKYAERRSKGNFAELTLPNDPILRDTVYNITGWHWFRTGGGPIWAQSKAKIDGKFNSYNLGFDDSVNDGDFNDLVISLEFLNPDNMSLTDEEINKLKPNLL